MLSTVQDPSYARQRIRAIDAQIKANNKANEALKAKKAKLAAALDNTDERTDTEREADEQAATGATI